MLQMRVRHRGHLRMAISPAYAPARRSLTDHDRPSGQWAHGQVADPDSGPAHDCKLPGFWDHPAGLDDTCHRLAYDVYITDGCDWPEAGGDDGPPATPSGRSQADGQSVIRGVLQKDAFLVFRALCRLSIRSSDSAAATDVSAARGKVRHTSLYG